MRTERKIRILEKLAAAPYAKPPIGLNASNVEQTLGRSLRNPKTGGNLPYKETERLMRAAGDKKRGWPKRSSLEKMVGRTFTNPKTGKALPPKEKTRLENIAMAKIDKGYNEGTGPGTRHEQALSRGHW